jgi:arabinosaccharide transport system substrate-binding protein
MPHGFKQRLADFFSLTTPAVWVLLVLSVGAASIVLPGLSEPKDGLKLWVFNKGHQEAYEPMIAAWNAEQATTDTRAETLLLHMTALERRLLSGFMSGTPLADLVETERSVGAKTFTGPLEDIGFVDITDRLREEGLMDALNAPSFAPWTSRGRIFGIPHDVHPMLLVYRADIVEEAGIDLSRVETWEEFFPGSARPEKHHLAG